MNEMSAEEIRVMAEINQKLKANNLMSRLSRFYISGIKNGSVTEWEWEKVIPEEGAQPSIIVSEAVRVLFES